MPQLNWIFIGLSAFVPLIFGALWYSDGVAQLMSGEKGSSRKHPIFAYVLCYLLSILIAMMISGQMSTHTAADQNSGHIAFHGAALAAFVVLPVMTVHFMFEGDRSVRNMIYHILYWILSFGIMGAIIGSNFPPNSITF